ncbi:unnamed protein product [Tuber melanosporum]|uniref:(Perigord truffle) hypothetical protein n=1 Tax=Tuber melanosporum (strain Mel28) TaxID=656061 RepID=D5G6N8_TUBMM|nr:uncharacterized protein GSTUM_00002145001 [Tuber melanosporum]CAZ80181.1 unnamed protein product [Tuber melanosporum]
MIASSLPTHSPPPMTHPPDQLMLQICPSPEQETPINKENEKKKKKRSEQTGYNHSIPAPKKVKRKNSAKPRGDRRCER